LAANSGSVDGPEHVYQTVKLAGTEGLPNDVPFTLCKFLRKARPYQRWAGQRTMEGADSIEGQASL